MRLVVAVPTPFARTRQAVSVAAVKPAFQAIHIKNAHVSRKYSRTFTPTVRIYAYYAAEPRLIAGINYVNNIDY